MYLLGPQSKSGRCGDLINIYSITLCDIRMKIMQSAGFIVPAGGSHVLIGF